MAHLQTSIVIPASRLEAFDYLNNPAHLRFLLEPKIEVEVLTPEVPLKRGSEFHFMMARMGLSQTVRFHIEDVVRGSRLVYRQVEGLFLSWMHTVRFEDHGEGETLVTDLVDYELPFGIIGHLANDLILRADLTAILEMRLQKARAHFSEV